MPSISIPKSDNIVSVKILRSFWRFKLPSAPFFFAASGGPVNETWRSGGFSFLIEHASGQKVVFDLGIRKDTENLPPIMLKRFSNEQGLLDVDIDKDVATQLVEGGVDLNDINAVIWSHTHFDHTGDTTTFPATTALVLGEGAQKHVRPAYPINPESGNLESDFEGREVREVVFDGPIIAGTRTYDYFGDGSFYLLDTPGHCPGHITGLARVTPSLVEEDATFILMGADTIHHVGLIRPSKHVPIPASVAATLPPVLKNLVDSGNDRPFLIKSPPDITVDHDPETYQKSVAMLAAFDADPNVWVIVSHDASLEPSFEGSVFDLFPLTANSWKGKGCKEKTFWAFVNPEGAAWEWGLSSK